MLQVELSESERDEARRSSAPAMRMRGRYSRCELKSIGGIAILQRSQLWSAILSQVLASEQLTRNSPHS